MEKPKLFVGQSEDSLFYKIQDQEGKLKKAGRIILTEENKNRFWYEAARKILPTLEELVPVCERKGAKQRKIYGQHIKGSDYDLVNKFLSYEPLTQEQLGALIRRINTLRTAF